MAFIPSGSALHPIDLELPLRGKRNYFHGTDIFPALMAITGPVVKLSLQLHRMSVHPLQAIQVDAQGIQALRGSGRLQAMLGCQTLDSRPLYLAVVEDATRSLGVRRIAWDEDAVIASSAWTAGSLIDRSQDSGSLIERLVALNKKLLNGLKGPTEWLFSRMDLNAFPISAVEIRLELERELGEGHFVSSITCDGIRQGRLFFSRRMS